MELNAVIAKILVDKIIADLTDRRGLGGEWEQIDEDIQAEIRLEWEIIALNAIQDAPKENPNR